MAYCPIRNETLPKLVTKIINTFNSSPPRQDGHHATGDIFKCIFMNEKSCILIEIPPKFVPKVRLTSQSIDKSVLIQVMAWRQRGNKPLTEPMQTQFTDAYMQYNERWVNGDIIPQQELLNKACDCLTHWGRNKIAHILQMIFSIVFF